MVEAANEIVSWITEDGSRKSEFKIKLLLTVDRRSFPLFKPLHHPVYFNKVHSGCDS